MTQSASGADSGVIRLNKSPNSAEPSHVTGVSVMESDTTSGYTVQAFSQPVLLQQHASDSPRLDSCNTDNDNNIATSSLPSYINDLFIKVYGAPLIHSMVVTDFLHGVRDGLPLFGTEV